LANRFAKYVSENIEKKKILRKYGSPGLNLSFAPNSEKISLTGSQQALSQLSAAKKIP
jgi:hypothetical protein